MGGFDLNSHWPPRTTPSTSASAETASSAHEPTDRRDVVFLFLDAGAVEVCGETTVAGATGGRATIVGGADGMLTGSAGQGSTFFAAAVGAAVGFGFAVGAVG